MMLQKEKSKFETFDWYTEWTETAKKEPILSWINDARTDFFHRQALEPKSWMELRCIGNPRITSKDWDEDDEDGPNHTLQMNVNPFICTHQYIGRPWPTDHCHEYERHWEIVGLPGYELLSACADVYDSLDALVSEAHRRLEATTKSYKHEGSKRALPCMEDTARYRIIKSVMKEGREVWDDEPPGFHRK
jgi:hypothetical protein